MGKIMKIMLLSIVVLFIAGIGLQLASAAEPTHQYIKQYMNPLYRQSMDADTDYTYTLTVEAPDRISEIVSAMLTMQVWHNPTVNYYVWVNGQTCNTETFQVHTSYANAGEGTIFFDCSNVITGEGTYDITFRTDDDIGASTFWADITYSNRPKGTAEVHGTEYEPGALGKVWVQLLDETGEDVVDGACQIDIYTPDNTILIENGGMTNMNHDGVYYYDLVVPQAQGVYPAIAKCYYDITETNNYVNSSNIVTGILNDKTYIATHEIGGDRHKIEQDAGEIEVEYTFNSMCGTDIDELFLTGIDLTTIVKWKDSPVNDDLNIWVYNYTASDWIELPNKIISPNDLVLVTNFIETNNVTRDGYVSGTGDFKIKFNDTLLTGTNEKAEFDFIEATCLEYSDPIWTEVKGSSELHVSSDKSWVTQVESGEITNDTWTGNFIYNVTLSSQTSRLEEEQRIFVEMPGPFPCHHVNQLFVDGVELNWTPEQPVAPLRAGCSVNWIQDLSKSQNYHVSIIAENYFKEEEQNWVVQNQMEYAIIDIACENYQEANGLPNYTIPATTPLNYGTQDELWRACQQYLDGYYHFNKTYFNGYQTPEGVFTEADMKGLDELYAHLVIVNDDLDQLAQAIMNGLQTGADYSVAVINDPYPPANPSWTTYFANISSTYINYQLLAGIAGGSFVIPVNNTAIADAVWTSTTTPSGNILNAFSANIWNYSNRQLTAFDFLVGLNSTALSDIWSYVTRGLTEQVDVDWETGAEYVWNSSTRGLTEAVNANVDWATGAQYNWNATTRELTAIVWDHETAAEYVWNESTRELTAAPFDPNLIANATWNYADRQLTTFNFTVDADVDAGLISDYVWNETIRGLTENTNPNIDWSTGTDYVWNATTRELTAITWDHENAANYVWNDTSRTLTEAPFDPTLIANATWNYAMRGLTEQVDVNDTLIADSVWQYNGTPLDSLLDKLSGNIWSAAARTLTGFDLWDHETAAEYVWNATNRTITETPISAAEISDAVWAYANRNLTYTEDVFNYTALNNNQDDLLAAISSVDDSVWNNSNRTLTSAPFDPNLIAQAVWTFTNRNMTYIDWDTASDFVWNNSARELTGFDFVVDATINNTELVFDVWNAATRELTNFSFTVDTTLNESEISTLTADEVWTYYNRSLTDSVDVNINASAVQNAVWNAPARYTHGVDLT